MAIDEALAGLEAVAVARPAWAPVVETLRNAAATAPELGELPRAPSVQVLVIKLCSIAITRTSQKLCRQLVS